MNSQALHPDVTARRRAPRLHIPAIATIARKEIRDALRNRWFLLYAAAFSILALALSFLSMAGIGETGFAGFGRTAASLVNLVMLIVPLMALSAGAAAIAPERERGTLAHLLAQPITRFELLAGKYLGLAAALIAALTFGFGLSALIMAIRGGSGDIRSFIALVGLSLILALAMLSVGFVISVCTSRAGVAAGAAIFTWLSLVFIGDLGLMGSALIMELRAEQLFHLSLLNPLQVFKMASLSSVNASLDVLGPVGTFATLQYADRLPIIFGAMLAAWIIVPLTIAHAVLTMRGGT